MCHCIVIRCCLCGRREECERLRRKLHTVHLLDGYKLLIDSVNYFVFSQREASPLIYCHSCPLSTLQRHISSASLFLSSVRPFIYSRCLSRSLSLTNAISCYFLASPAVVGRRAFHAVHFTHTFLCVYVSAVCAASYLVSLRAPLTRHSTHHMVMRQRETDRYWTVYATLLLSQVSSWSLIHSLTHTR